MTQPEHAQAGDGRDAKRKLAKRQQVEFHPFGLMQEMLPTRSYVNAPVKLTVWLVVTSGEAVSGGGGDHIPGMSICEIS